jgi:hypothetical protein
MVFDTGAQISFLQYESLGNFPAMGAVTDFYPLFGGFQTETHLVSVTLGTVRYELRCGALPDSIGMRLTGLGIEGIIGNDIMRDRILGYFPRRNALVLA